MNGLKSKMKQMMFIILIFVLVLGATSLVLADDITADADALAVSSPHGNGMTATQAGGTTVSYPFSAVINQNSKTADDVFPTNTPETEVVTVAVTGSGNWLDSYTPSLSFTGYTQNQAGAISVSVPCGAAAANGSTTITLNLVATASNGRALKPDSVNLSFVITAGADAATCTPPNTNPTVSVTGVINGASYAKGQVPAAMCSVVDTEDGNSTFTATLSAITGPNAVDQLGSQTASCSYTDAGGATATASATYTVYDPTAPVIGYTLNPAAPNGLNNWYTTDVSLTWSVTESESPNSLAKTGCVDQMITVDQPETTYSCAASSAGGSATPVTVSIKRDATAPVVTITPARAADHNGWYNQPVAFTFTSDDGSACEAAKTYSGPDSGTATISGTCTDAAGNVGTGSLTFQYDATAPQITAAFTPAKPASGWWNIASGVPTVQYTCADDVSQIASCTPDYTFVEGADQSHPGTAVDNAGNSATVQVTDVDVDLHAPSITGSPDRAANSNNWYNADVTVAFTCDDSLSGVASCSGNATLAEGASQMVNGSVADNAGNTASTTVGPINIDKTFPTITDLGPTPSTPNGANGWYTSLVINKFEAADGLSGLAGPATILVSTATAEGSAVTVSSGDVSDLAGNVTPAITSAAFKIDLSNPTNIAFVGGPADGASYYFGAVPAAPTCTATDAISGLAGCSVSGYSGAVGPHTLIATATDNAGRTATATRSYTVLAWTLKGFYQPVDMGANVINNAKGGSTVPLKFEVFAGSTEFTDVSVISAFTQKIACATGTGDDIEQYATGGTTLRYDTTGGQFIFNWQTPKIAGACYRVTMQTADGSFLSANFRLK